MAFIMNKEKEVNTNITNTTNIRTINEIHKDAMNKGILIAPFDIYEYVSSFDDIELNNNDSLNIFLTGLVEKYKDGFVLSISKHISIENQRRVLAKLFAHLILHKDYILQNGKIEIKNLCTADELSKEADDFASRLLMPKATFITIVRELRTVGHVSDYFKVTPKMVKKRLSNLWD